MSIKALAERAMVLSKKGKSISWDEVEELKELMRDGKFFAIAEALLKVLEDGENMSFVLNECVDSLRVLRENGIYVWPNHPKNPETQGRKALEAHTKLIKELSSE